MHVGMFLLYKKYFKTVTNGYLFLNDSLFHNDVSPIFVLVISGPILDIGVIGAFFSALFLKIGYFICLYPLSK